MREGFRRLALAIKVVSWVWFGGWALYFTWEWFTHNYEYETPLAGRFLIAIPTAIGLGIAWIVEGFAKPDPPQRLQEDDPDTSERESFFSFVTRRDGDR